MRDDGLIEVELTATVDGQTVLAKARAVVRPPSSDLMPRRVGARCWPPRPDCSSACRSPAAPSTTSGHGRRPRPAAVDLPGRVPPRRRRPARRRPASPADCRDLCRARPQPAADDAAVHARRRPGHGHRHGTDRVHAGPADHRTGLPAHREHRADGRRGQQDRGHVGIGRPRRRARTRSPRPTPARRPKAACCTSRSRGTLAGRHRRSRPTIDFTLTLGRALLRPVRHAHGGFAYFGSGATAACLGARLRLAHRGHDQLPGRERHQRGDGRRPHA